MRLLPISAAGCAAILLMSASANAGGSSHHSTVSTPVLHSAVVPNTTTYHPDAYIPKSPQNPYGTPTGSGSSGVAPYAVPAQPQNPYPSSTNRGPVTPTQYAMPVAAADGTSSPASYTFRCVVNQAGDYCAGAAISPVSVGTACTCGTYNGYTQ